tara:strand:+ start:3950 stop:4750 length:801 start_codon:yes stop_codon:yes gene_type:complete
MAIFEDNRELARQERFVGMDKVDGWKKTALAVMGYKDTGEKNWWGKTGLPGGLSRGISKSLAKGTDTAEVFKETDDEYAAAQMAKAKFGFETAKAVVGLGGIGGGSNAGNMIEGGGIGGGKDIATSTAGNNLTKVLEEQSTRVARDKSDSDVNSIIGNKSDSELIKSVGKEDREYFIDSSGRKIYKNNEGEELDLTPEGVKARKEAKRQERLGQASNLLDKIPLVGDAASAGLDLIAANRNVTLESEKEARKYLTKTAKDPQFNLL